MPIFADRAELAGEAYLESLRKTQEGTIEAVRLVAKLTIWSAPNDEVIADATSQETAAAVMDFANKLLDNQREFAERLLEAIRPPV